MPTTSYMGLSLPSVSVTAGPAWATALNAAFSAVDAHDHTSGKGTPVPSAGLNINSDLSFGGYNAAGLRSARFSSQPAALAETYDLGCLSNVGGDLYWNNGSGTAVQVTSGGSVAGASGTITGLSSPASAAFNSGSGTFTFQQAASTAAIMDGGPVVIRDTAASALGITVQSPTGLAAAYSITLPAALPSGTRFVTMTSAGVLAASIGFDISTVSVDGSGNLYVPTSGITATQLAADAVTTAKIAAGAVTAAKIGTGEVGATQLASSAVTTAKIAANAVTRAKLDSVGQQVSSSSGSFIINDGSTTFHNITNLAVTLTTTGRPVMLMFVPDGSASVSQVRAQSTANTPAADFQIVVSGSASANIGLSALATDNNDTGTAVPPGALNTFYAPAAGTYTFTAQAKALNADTIVNVSNVKLVAWEL
jgi:hypothetical protein